MKPKGEYHLNNYLKNKTEKFLTDDYLERRER